MTITIPADEQFVGFERVERPRPRTGEWGRSTVEPISWTQVSARRDDLTGRRPSAIGVAVRASDPRDIARKPQPSVSGQTPQPVG
jgi:hypothetical protein